MPGSMVGPPSLYREPTEYDAFACEDEAVRIYWVRVLAVSLIRKRINGREVFTVGNRLETPDGYPVKEAESGYLIFNEERMNWISVRAVGEPVP
jgi:hypothetical protein